MTNREVQQSTGPWPGPIPYGERDRDFFRGRRTDIEALAYRLQTDRLVVLTAESGVGKTSLIRAGLVPWLRTNRRNALREEHESFDHSWQRSPDWRGAVLILRDWVGRGRVSADTLLIDAIERGLDSRDAVLSAYKGDPRRDSIREDFDTLSSAFYGVPRQEPAREFIARLAAAAGSLVLIIDQFEEAFHSGAARTTALWNTLAEVYRNQDNVRTLVSFRREYLYTALVPLSQEAGSLRLDTQIKELGKLTHYLGPIAPSELRTALTESASAGGASIDHAVVTTLLDWLSSGIDRSQLATPAGDVEHDPSRDTSSVDLLKLQAILVDLYRTARKSAREVGKDDGIAITSDTLQALLARELRDARQERIPKLSPDELHELGAKVADRALEEFFEHHVLPLPEDFTPNDGLPQDHELSTEEDELVQRRRAAVRMAPFLSSGDLKIAASETDLISDSWASEWIRLEIDRVKIETVLKKLGSLTTATDSNLREALKDAGVAETPLEIDRGQVSGSSLAKLREQPRSQLDEAFNLLKISQDTLESLRSQESRNAHRSQNGVLRAKNTEKGIVWELVHDGFGQPIRKWAENVRFSPLDVLPGTVAWRGDAFAWDRLSGGVKDVCWRGCWVGPKWGAGHLTFEAVTFQRADLAGTLFENCHFKGGGFFNCDITGVVFRDCTFTALDGQPVLFENLTAAGVSFIRCTFAGVQFAPPQESAGSDILPSASRGNYFRKLEWVGGSVESVGDQPGIAFDGWILSQWGIDGTELKGPLCLRNCYVTLSDLVDLANDAKHVDFKNCRLLMCRVGVAGQTALLEELLLPEAGNELFPPQSVDKPLDLGTGLEFIWGDMAQSETPDREPSGPDGSSEAVPKRRKRAVSTRLVSP